MKIHGKIATSAPRVPLAAQIWLDDHCIWQSDHVDGEYTWQHEFDSASGQTHRLRVVLSNKMPQHTVVDTQGNIVQDAVLEVCDLYIDDLLVDKLLHKSAMYEHEHSDTPVPFHGILGCNGTATVTFYNPVPVWYLEHF